MLSDEEIRELKEMAASESLREDFRIMRRNSREIAQQITVEELARWLTAINRICPIDAKSRRPIRDGDMRL
jgi:hypothetical protein